MALRPRYATLIAVVVSAILGFYGLSSLLISRLRGIGPSAYPGGPWIQSILVDIDPGLARLGAGTVYVVGLVVLAFLVVFFFVRSAARNRSSLTSPGQASASTQIFIMFLPDLARREFHCDDCVNRKQGTSNLTWPPFC